MLPLLFHLTFQDNNLWHFPSSAHFLSRPPYSSGMLGSQAPKCPSWFSHRPTVPAHDISIRCLALFVLGLTRQTKQCVPTKCIPQRDVHWWMVDKGYSKTGDHCTGQPSNKTTWTHSRIGWYLVRAHTLTGDSLLNNPVPCTPHQKFATTSKTSPFLSNDRSSY